MLGKRVTNRVKYRVSNRYSMNDLEERQIELMTIETIVRAMEHMKSNSITREYLDTIIVERKRRMNELYGVSK